MKLYVGNIPAELSKDDLKTFFEQYGEVRDANIICDKQTGMSRGYGFVELNSEDTPDEVIEQANGAVMGENTIKVAPAKGKSKRGGGGFSGRGRGMGGPRGQRGGGGNRRFGSGSGGSRGRSNRGPKREVNGNR